MKINEISKKERKREKQKIGKERGHRTPERERDRNKELEPRKLQLKIKSIWNLGLRKDHGKQQIHDSTQLYFTCIQKIKMSNLL